MNSSPIIVCGLPRCGSSLAMQMLHAAGIRCAGQFPSFEPKEATENRSAEYVSTWQDGAFKLLDPHQLTLPTGFKYRFVFLTRSRRQQALSSLKLLRLMGQINGAIDDAQMSRFENSLRDDEAKSFKAISDHEGSILKLRFEDLVGRPAPTVNRLAWFLNLSEQQEDRMRRCVRVRSVSCYPGMLELEMMAEMKAAAAEELPMFLTDEEIAAEKADQDNKIQREEDA